MSAAALGTKYPAQIDDEFSLRAVTDGIDTVFEGDHDASRAAILALEAKVGIDSSTVSTSFDYRIRQQLALINPIVNPGFEIWQRGTSFTVDNTDTNRTADNWVGKEGNAANTFVVERDAVTIDGNSQYSAKCTFTYSTGVAATLWSRVEDYQQYQDKTVTFAIRVNASAAGKVRVTIFDGNLSTNGSTNVTSGAWETISVTHTLGAAGSSQLDCIVTFEASSSTVYLDNATLGISSVPLPYVPKPRGIELLECYRHYEILGSVAGGFPHIDKYGLSAGVSVQQVGFTTEKSGVPTITTAGTWVVSNCAPANSRPITTGPTKFGFAIYVVPTATDRILCYPDSADDVITAEHNL